jgi:CDP-diacylglycerol--glycerol-3-phosphate 3-phosphatidyltransferase
VIPDPRRWKRIAPSLLTTIRLLMGPLALWTAYDGLPRRIFVLCLVVAFVSDYYDGKLARRFDVSTPLTRRYDSITDLSFYLCILWCAWKLHPSVVLRFAWGIGAVLALDLLCHIASLARFGRLASTHCVSAKLWNVLLFASFIDLLSFGRAGGLLWLTIFWGCVAEAEALLIILSAPRWPSDVRGFLQARQLYRGAGHPL